MTSLFDCIYSNVVPEHVYLPNCCGFDIEQPMLLILGTLLILATIKILAVADFCNVIARRCSAGNGVGFCDLEMTSLTSNSDIYEII